MDTYKNYIFLKNQIYWQKFINLHRALVHKLGLLFFCIIPSANLFSTSVFQSPRINMSLFIVGWVENIEM